MTRVALLLTYVFAAYAFQSAAGGSVPPAPLFESSKIYSGVVGVSSLGDVKSCPVKPWTTAQTASRVKVVKVPFPVTFYKPPGVTFSITWLDSDKNYNLRYDVDIIDVTTKDFIISFKTWCNTYIYSIKVTYWAFGATMCLAPFAST